MTAPAARLATALADRYRLERELGAGGMATVYLAEDLKHDRKVAIKVLKPELAAVLGAERFVVEIKTTAAMSHPHILPLFDSGTADGFLYYVMPYIQGETIREKLNRETQFGVDEAIRITREVADALDYAHRHGVIHRDIKPENILLHDGRAMVMDFGIALAISAAAGGRMTETGLSLGTPHYMSPEQATADKELTGRSDQYSLATVAYEMLSGNPPHTGSSAQQIIMKIIAEPAEAVTRYRKAVPPNVAAALSRALEKIPADRFESTKAFADALGNPAFTLGLTSAAVPDAGAPSRRPLLALLAATTLVSTGAAAWGFLRPAPQTSAHPVVTRAFVTLPDSVPLMRGRPVVSADGRTIAFVGESPGPTRRLYLRPAAGVDSRVVMDLDRRINSLALAPDGSGVAFLVGDSLLKSEPIGSPPVLLMRVAPGSLRSVHWGVDRHLLVASGRVLSRIPATGGKPDTLLFASGDSVRQLGSPVLLPDGKAVLFAQLVVTTGAVLRDEVRVLDLESRTSRSVVAGSVVSFVEPGFLVYAVDQALVAQAFDLRTRTDSGPTAVLLNTTFSGAISPNGVGAFSESSAAMPQLYSVENGGTPALLNIPGGDIRSVRLDRAGRRLLHGRNVPGGQIFVTDLALGSNIMILPGTWRGFDPFWSPGDLRVTFHSSGPTSSAARLMDGYEVSADGSGMPRRLFNDSLSVAPQGWLPDGKLLARGSMRGAGTGLSDLMVHTFSGDSATSTPWLRADWDERSAVPSPDGRFVAFVSTEAGHDEVTVRPYPDPSAGKWVISEGTANDPMWSRDGRTLYYWEGQVLRAARLRTSPTFSVMSRETVLTDPDYYRSCCFPNYDVSPDGKRIILARRPAQARATGFVLVTNWNEEIRARLAEAARQ